MTPFIPITVNCCLLKKDYSRRYSIHLWLCRYRTVISRANFFHSSSTFQTLVVKENQEKTFDAFEMFSPVCEQHDHWNVYLLQDSLLLWGNHFCFQKESSLPCALIKCCRLAPTSSSTSIGMFWLFGQYKNPYTAMELHAYQTDNRWTFVWSKHKRIRQAYSP